MFGNNKTCRSRENKNETGGRIYKQVCRIDFFTKKIIVVACYVYASPVIVDSEVKDNEENGFSVFGVFDFVCRTDMFFK